MKSVRVLAAVCVAVALQPLAHGQETHQTRMAFCSAAFSRLEDEVSQLRDELAARRSFLARAQLKQDQIERAAKDAAITMAAANRAPKPDSYPGANPPDDQTKNLSAAQKRLQDLSAERQSALEITQQFESEVRAADLALTERTTALDALKNRLATWQSTSSESDWAALTFEVTSFAARYGIYSNLTICTTTPGAFLKYQTEWDRAHGGSPISAGSPTNDWSEHLPIGSYYIWSERGGRVTSNRDALFEVVQANDLKTINERLPDVGRQ